MLKKAIPMTLLFLTALFMLTACNSAQPEPEPEPGPPVLEPEPEPEPEITEDELSGDLDSLMFRLDGVLYTLPVRAAELESNGWRADWDYVVNPGETVGSRLLRIGDLPGQEIGVSLFNFSEEGLPLNEIYIDRISVGAGWENRAELIFPGNIMIGSSYDEIIAAHGMPDEKEYWVVSEEFSYLIFSMEYAAARFVIENETNLIWSMDMYCLRRNSIAEDSAAALVAYETPTDLGDNWRELIIKIAGDLYRLPAPASAFLENGWFGDPAFHTLHARLNPGVVEESWVLHRGDQLMWLRLRNYDDVIRSDAQVVVVEILIDLSWGFLPFELPGGITEASTSEDVIMAFGAPDEISEFGDLRAYVFGDLLGGLIAIQFDIETEEIQSIVIRYSPESLQ